MCATGDAHIYLTGSVTGTKVSLSYNFKKCKLTTSQQGKLLQQFLVKDLLFCLIAIIAVSLIIFGYTESKQLREGS